MGTGAGGLCHLLGGHQGHCRAPGVETAQTWAQTGWPSAPSLQLLGGRRLLPNFLRKALNPPGELQTRCECQAQPQTPRNGWGLAPPQPRPSTGPQCPAVTGVRAHTHRPGVCSPRPGGQSLPVDLAWGHCGMNRGTGVTPRRTFRLCLDASRDGELIPEAPVPPGSLTVGSLPFRARPHVSAPPPVPVPRFGHGTRRAPASGGWLQVTGYQTHTHAL